MREREREREKEKGRKRDDEKRRNHITSHTNIYTLYTRISTNHSQRPQPTLARFPAGNAVLATIHQPSSEIFALFTDVIVLAEGRVAYQGPREEMDAFFNSIGEIVLCD